MIFSTILLKQREHQCSTLTMIHYCCQMIESFVDESKNLRYSFDIFNFKMTTTKISKTQQTIQVNLIKTNCLKINCLNLNVHMIRLSQTLHTSNAFANKLNVFLR